MFHNLFTLLVTDDTTMIEYSSNKVVLAVSLLFLQKMIETEGCTQAQEEADFQQ